MMTAPFQIRRLYIYIAAGVLLFAGLMLFAVRSRFAEDELGLPTLTNRDKAANNMMGAFDFNQSARPPFLLKQRTCRSR